MSFIEIIALLKNDFAGPHCFVQSRFGPTVKSSSKGLLDIILIMMTFIWDQEFDDELGQNRASRIDQKAGNAVICTNGLQGA